MRCVCFAAGSEFLLPVRGFFCLLCEEFYGDAICAEEHVTTHAHNEKYKVFTCEYLQMKCNTAVNTMNNSGRVSCPNLNKIMTFKEGQSLI